MKSTVRRLALLWIAFALAPELAAQKLPEGRYHNDRQRTYDIVHYKAEISLNFGKKQVLGKSTIRLVPLRQVDTLSLDAIRLNVESVTLSGTGSSLTFRTTSRSLDIVLPQTEGPGDTLNLVVTYTAIPKSGMYFRRDPEHPKLYYVTTYGENGLHANWLPIYNDVNDKFSSEMVVTVPPPYVVISNGKLVEKRRRPDGQTTYHWLQTLPHSNYLIALYVGDFERGTLPSAFGTIPLHFWVPKGHLKEGAYAFRNTTKMVEFFSRRFNYRYPWDKYDQVAVPDYAIGAMEHTGVTGHRASVLRDRSAPLEFSPKLNDYTDDWTAEATISHELAHHWFGDNLTCRNLSYIWLNESFASYLMMLWDEESQGRDQLLFDVQLARKHYFDYVRSEHVIRSLEYHYFDDANTIYNTAHTYLKGAAVLHMLRGVLGDEAFFRALSYYLHKHEFSNVVSNDLRIAIEEATGENLQWFFDQWVTGAGHPVFEINYHYLPDRKMVELHVAQVQPLVKGQGVFTLPVRITLATPNKTWKEKVWIRGDDEYFLFPSDEAPLMVSFDGEGDLVAEIRFPKDIDELVYQAFNDALPGRIWAIRELASSYPTRSKTLETLAKIISGASFWGLKAEAAYQLGTVRTPDAERVATRALKSADYRVRKAAVLALARFGTSSAERKLKEVIEKDSQNDVVATAIVALARAYPGTDPAFIRQQLGRKSWYDEITIAVLRAFRELGDPALVPTIRRYVGDTYNQDVRQAALSAWEACAPEDRALHDTLLALTDSPVYTLQQEAINMLGRLHVTRAVDLLQKIVAEDVDANLTTAAKKALDEINRVSGKPE